MELCYIIKISAGGTHFYKIGERRENSDRIEKLKKAYFNNAYVKFSVISDGIELPQNQFARLNDDAVRKGLSKKVFKPADTELVKALLHDTDGTTEFVQTIENMTDEDVEAEVRATIERLGKNEKNFTSKISFSMRGTEDATKRHLVTYPLMQQIEGKAMMWENIGQKILFIGQFDHEWICSLAGYNDVTILFDDASTEYQFSRIFEGNKNGSIKTFIELKEVIEMCKKFDVIIANPPYAIGNEITRAVVENVEYDKYISLMPVSKYKKNELFRYVESIEKAEDTFEDATVGDCLAIAELNDHPCGKFNSWEDFTLVTYDETFRKFYEENRKKKVNSSVIVGAINTTKLPRPIDETTFYCMQRVCAHGIDMSGYPYEFNNGRMSCEELTKKICKIKDNNPIVWGQCIWFESIEAKKNFSNFYYRMGTSGLMHKLIKGLNRNGGSIADAIPNVDWTHPWTDEELLADYGYTEEEIKNILG